MKKRRQVHGHPEMTPQEMARCRPAAEVDPIGLPIPTHLVSNEEYFPPFLQTDHQKRVEARVLSLNSARLYGVSPDLTGYGPAPGDYDQRIAGNAELLKTMEYDDRIPDELPNDRFEQLRSEYREQAETGFGVPHSNDRAGWIRVR